MTGLEYVQSIKCPVVFFSSTGNPRNRVALLEDTELPFNLAVLDGTLEDGERGQMTAARCGGWRWDGIGDPTDHRGNSVTLITISDDAETYDAQQEEYDAAV